MAGRAESEDNSSFGDDLGAALRFRGDSIVAGSLLGGGGGAERKKSEELHSLFMQGIWIDGWKVLLFG